MVKVLSFVPHLQKSVCFAKQPPVDIQRRGTLAEIFIFANWKATGVKVRGSCCQFSCVSPGAVKLVTGPFPFSILMSTDYWKTICALFAKKGQSLGAPKLAANVPFVK